MVVSPPGSVMLVRLVHSWKAEPPMVVSVSGKAMLVRLLQP